MYLVDAMKEFIQGLNDSLLSCPEEIMHLGFVSGMMIGMINGHTIYFLSKSFNIGFIKRIFKIFL